MKKIIYLCGASLALLTACAPPKAPSMSDLPEQSQKTLPANETTAKTAPVKPGNVPNSFVLSGAIAAKSHQKGWSATVNWHQSAPHAYQITLIGPMGSQAVRIEEQHGKVVYHEGSQTLSSANGDDLLAKKTGIHLPVSSLYYWVRGIQAPGSVQSASRNASGQLQSLKQSGYSIEYLDYMSAGSYVLPHKIRLSGKDVAVKLVVKHWQV